jgi:hypothetical protein
VNTVTAHHRTPVQRRRSLNFDDQAVSATVGVTLFRDDIGLALLPRDEVRLNSAEVFFGAAKFQPTVGELRSDHVIY